MVKDPTHTLEGRGDPVRGLYLHIRGWMPVSNLLDGITGIKQRMNEVHASMSTGCDAKIKEYEIAFSMSHGPNGKYWTSKLQKLLIPFCTSFLNA